MTVDLILHGVPNGQDIWGVSDDTHYISTFYVQKEDKETLSIEMRKVSGKSYCYYNYLKYNGVTASDGRAGAYLGITLRFDAYYKDILNVYHLCEIVYNNLLDTILIKNGESVKFKIAKFEDTENELVEIKKKLFNLINLSATAKDFTPINDSFFSNDSKTVKAFLLDCTPDNVMQAIVKYGKVEISKYHPSVNEAKKLRGVEERYIATIAQKDKDLQNANLQIEDMTSELDSTRSENEQLRSLISKMENTIKRSEHAVKESEAMKRQIQELKSYLHKQNKENEQLKTELIEYKGHQTLPDVKRSTKRPHSKRKGSQGRQSSSHSDIADNYYSEDYLTDSYNRTSILEKISSFWTFPLWQKITIIVIVLILLCSSIYGVIRLCSSDNRSVKTEQPDKASSYIDVDEHSEIDANMDYSNKDITFENISNTDNDEDE